MTDIEEKDLIQQLGGGSKDAFKRLFEYYYPLFVTFVTNMIKDEFAADDIVQNVFLRVWICREKLDPSKGLKNYLLVSVRNEVYCHHRNAFLKRSGPIESDYLDETAGPDQECFAKELNGRLEQIILEMPQRRREVFCLSRNSGLKNSEIAARLGLSVRTVEKHLEVALADIRKNLAISVLFLVTMM